MLRTCSSMLLERFFLIISPFQFKCRTLEKDNRQTSTLEHTHRYAPHAAWFELVELFRKFFYTLAMIFVEPMYPNQLYAGMFAAIGFSLLNAYIKPFTDIYSQLNAQFVDLALFFVMAGAISLKVSEDYPADESASSVDITMTLTSVLPLVFIVFSMVAELDTTKHFVEDLTIKLRQLKYGIFGVNISKSDVILDHFFGCCGRRCCCIRWNKPVAKYPKLSVTICRPLQQMNTVIATLVHSEERLNLLNKLVQRVSEFTYKVGSLSFPLISIPQLLNINNTNYYIQIHRSGETSWRHKLSKKLYKKVFSNADDDFGDELMQIASKRTSGGTKKKKQKYVLDSEMMKILATNLVDAMVEYIRSLEDIEDKDDVGLDTFNRIRSLIRFINGLLTVALGKVSVSFGKVLSVSLEDVDEVTMRAIFEALQKVEDNIRLIGMIRAFKRAAKEERKRLKALDRKKKQKPKGAVVKPVSDEEEDTPIVDQESRSKSLSATIEMSPVVVDDDDVDEEKVKDDDGDDADDEKVKDDDGDDADEEKVKDDDGEDADEENVKGVDDGGNNDEEDFEDTLEEDNSSSDDDEPGQDIDNEDTFQNELHDDFEM